MANWARCAWLTYALASNALRIDGTLWTRWTLLTQFTAIAGRALAIEADRLIHTGAAVQALLRLTVSRLLTRFTSPTVRALTDEPTVAVVTATAMFTWTALAFVDIRLTVLTRETRITAIACESIYQIQTTSIILTRLRCAIVYVVLTARTRITFSTFALDFGSTRRDDASAVI